jgi:hypothetical protein
MAQAYGRCADLSLHPAAEGAEELAAEGEQVAGPYGPTVNSIASERLVAWFEVLNGSRYHSCA